MTAPIVSTVIPTFDRARLVERAVQSVLCQSLHDWEVIVVDDGSRDATAEVMKRLQSADTRIRYIAHERRRGGAAARNTGIAAARAPLVAFLDSDDEWLPDKLALQVQLMDRRPHVGAVYCDYYRAPGGRLCRSRRVDGDVYAALARGWCPATTSLFLVRRELLEVVQGFDPVLPGLQDYDLWLRLAQTTNFDLVEKPLVTKHTHSTAQVSFDPDTRQRALYLFQAKWRTALDRDVGPGAMDQLCAALRADIAFNRAILASARGRRWTATRDVLRFVVESRGRQPRRLASLALRTMIGGAAVEAVRSWRETSRAR